MSKDWLTHPWLEKLLPDHLRPVDEHIFSDAHGLEIVAQTEAALDRLMGYGEQIKASQTFKKNAKTYHFRLKVNQKRMKLLAYDTPKSEAAIKKRILIVYIRKAYTPNNRQNRVKEASVQYIKNGKTFVRSIRKSRYFQDVFRKLHELDAALLGALMQENYTSKQTISSPTQKEETVSSNDEPYPIIKELEHTWYTRWHHLDHLIENRLKRLLEEIHQTVELYHLLDIEEKYTIKRMLQTDIPSLIETYLSLTEKDKKERTEALYEALTKMEITIRSMREKTERTKVEKMEHLLKLTDKRYPSSKHSDQK